MILCIFTRKRTNVNFDNAHVCSCMLKFVSSPTRWTEIVCDLTIVFTITDGNFENLAEYIYIFFNAIAFYWFHFLCANDIRTAIFVNAILKCVLTVKESELLEVTVSLIIQKKKKLCRYYPHLLEITFELINNILNAYKHIICEHSLRILA